MAKTPVKISKIIWLCSFIFVSTTFLMGDFCEDVLSVPIKIKYDPTEQNEEPMKLKITFEDITGVQAPDGDTGNPEIVLDSEGYSLPVAHKTIDFGNSGSVNVRDYASNLVGIFIRNIEYTLVYEDIPANIPPLGVYLTTQTQGNGEGGTFDWDKAILDGSLNQDTINTVADGEGENGLVLLGTTDEVYFHNPIPKFPSESGKHVLKRQTANIDRLSDIITENFKFEVVIVPTSNVVVREEDKHLLPDDKDGLVTVDLELTVVVNVKP